MQRCERASATKLGSTWKPKYTEGSEREEETRVTESETTESQVERPRHAKGQGPSVGTSDVRGSCRRRRMATIRKVEERLPASEEESGTEVLKGSCPFVYVP